MCVLTDRSLLSATRAARTARACTSTHPRLALSCCLVRPFTLYLSFFPVADAQGKKAVNPEVEDLLVACRGDRPVRVRIFFFSCFSLLIAFLFYLLAALSSLTGSW